MFILQGQKKQELNIHQHLILIIIFCEDSNYSHQLIIFFPLNASGVILILN